MPPDDETETPDSTTDSATVDVLRYGKGNSARHVTVPSGKGTMVVAAHRRDASRSRLVRMVVVIALALTAALAATLYADLAFGAIVVLVVVALGAAQEYLRGSPVPDLVDEAVHSDTADEEYAVDFHVEKPFKEEEEPLPDEAG